MSADTDLQTVAQSLADLRALAKSVKSLAEWRQVGRKATPEEIALAAQDRTPTTCIASSARTGLPCRRAKTPGAQVCSKHGGRSPQVMAAAEQRLLTAALPALTRMIDLSHSDHAPVAQRATADLLDRAGVGKLVQAKLTTAQAKASTQGGITVNIGFVTPTLEHPPLIDIKTTSKPRNL